MHLLGLCNGFHRSGCQTKETHTQGLSSPTEMGNWPTQLVSGKDYEGDTMSRTWELEFPPRELELHLTGTVSSTVINKQEPSY